jgi:hypothetical protein
MKRVCDSSLYPVENNKQEKEVTVPRLPELAPELIENIFKYLDLQDYRSSKVDQTCSYINK